MMIRTATKLGVGIAGCAFAAATSLMSVAPAQAAPVTAPAAPVVLGPGNASQSWFFNEFDEFLDHFFVECYPEGDRV
jgi:hypothetical protein